MHVLAPLAKKLLYRLVRVHDYERASTLMKTTMQLVVREDFRPIIPFITIPVDLFWGKNDGMTPYSDALYMQKHMPHAVLHTFNDGRHGIHRTYASQIIATILNDGQ